MKKIIFLDVNGVMNAKAFLGNKFGGTSRIEYRCARMLDRIVRETGCKIVISSSWRTSGMATLLKDFEEAPVAKETRDAIISVTPRLWGLERGYEIWSYLLEDPEIDRFVIIDNRKDMAGLESHLAQTNDDWGLIPSLGERVIRMLNSKDSYDGCACSCCANAPRIQMVS